MQNIQEAESLDDFRDAGMQDLDDKVWFLTDVDVEVEIDEE